ncbi:hypothetical protein LCGC14_2563860, partial [marine sediment metagenome]
VQAAPEPPEGTEPEGAPQTFEEAVTQLNDTTQRYKSLQGMFAPLNAKVSDLGHHQSAAAKSATAWKAHSDKASAENTQLRAHIAQLESGNGGSPAPLGSQVQSGDEGRRGEGDQTSRTVTLLKSINWNEHETMKKQGDDVAALWLAEKIIGITEDARTRDIQALRDQFDSFSKPIKESQADAKVRREVMTTALSSFNAVADLTGETGDPLFPELYDQKVASEVGKTWMSMGLPPEHLNSPAGVVQAILNYRFFKDSSALPPTASSPASPGDGDAEGEGGEGGTVPDNTHLNSRAIRALSKIPPAAPSAASARAEGGPAATIKGALRNLREADETFGFPTRK